jgi:molecular chaperone DnaK (HSP70)
MAKRYHLLAVTLLLSYIAVASANVLGFDFGSSYMKATLVKPGSPFSIVENTAAGRKTNTMVTLGSENRMFGADSLLEAGKYPLTTFSEMARTFGQTFEEAAISELKRNRYIFNEMVSDERDIVGWKITRAAYENEEEKEQILHSEFPRRS